MLSVLLYGRNDAHGYNLHKRATISLNCMAEVLEDTEDEIIFVDYNTPNDLPTFPEAIQDTLTERARRLIRVLRIRPVHHRPLSPLTHLVAIEPVSRNAALRRANPANRWVLSTNPDMIFFPRGERSSLSAICADLPDGCWHLPRFELPETLWEAFNRTDSRGILGRLADYARVCHLNEVVYGTREAIFDGHGDFQLMLRTDLEAIHGFNEEMIHGWHVDSNLARRMVLHRGTDNRSLLDYCFSYHCDHTRLASVGHGRNRVENDLRRFFDDVVRPDLPAQAESWGLAGVKLEEIRLTGDGSVTYFDLLGRLLPPPGTDYLEASFFAASEDLTYPAEHVVPYLCDVLGTLPRQSGAVWLGTRPRMFSLFMAVWRELGFSQPVRLPPALKLASDLPALPANTMVAQSDDEAFAGADLVFFEFGAISQDIADASEAAPAAGALPGGLRKADLLRLAPVRRAFSDFVAREQIAIAAGAEPRRVITINSNSTFFNSLVHEAMSVNRTPFSTRLRQGFVIASPPPAERWPCMPQTLADWLGPRLGRPHPVPIIEGVRLHTALTEMLNGAARPESDHLNLRAAAPLLALLEHPAVTLRHDAAVLTGVRQRLEQQRPSAQEAGRLRLPVTDDPGPSPRNAPCRLAAMEDWDADEEIVSLARRYFTGAFASGTFRRGYTLWWRLHFLARLRSAGLAEGNARLLVVADRPDALYDILTDFSRDVRVADLAPAEAPPLEQAPPHPFRDPARLTFHRGGPARLPAGPGFDAILFTCNTAFGRPGLERGFRLVTEAARRLRPGGLLLLAEQLVIDRPPRADEFGPEVGFAEGLAKAWENAAGLSRLPAAPAILTRATLNSLARSQKERALPHFITLGEDGLRAAGAWIFRKTGEPVQDADKQLLAACQGERAKGIVKLAAEPRPPSC